MEIIQKQTISEQVILLLNARINTGKYASGEKLPSESELSEELDVSRASVRSALAALASAGLISRKQGDGTYVTSRRPGLTSMASSVWEFKHLINSSGKECSIKGLEVVQRRPKENEISFLKLNGNDEIVSLKRLFYADEEPIIYSLNVFAASYLRHNCLLEDLELTKGLDDFVDSYCDFKITGVKVELSASQGEEEIKRIFDINSCVPLLKLVEVFHGKNGIPLVYTNNYIKEFTLPFHVLRPW
jgi:GntR family transcriptional regulator